MLLTPLFKQTVLLAWGQLVHPYQNFTAFGEIFESHFPHTQSASVAPARAKPSMVIHGSPWKGHYTLAEKAQDAGIVALIGGFPYYR